MTEVEALLLQAKPRIYLASVPGAWLLKHSTPAWRIKDPEKGFQRIVDEDRAKHIALGVLDQHRTFPNAIVLATDKRDFKFEANRLHLPESTRFLVVDGQHRLWSQNFSDYDASFACVIHLELEEVDMARLFLEINDNQKRVPSSLRWDLVRLVRPEDDSHAVAAADLIYDLSTREKSPLFQRVDLTGEQREISLKQGSLAPEIKSLVSSRISPLKELDYDHQYEVLVRYLSAIKSLDTDGWLAATTPFYKARVLRSLLRLLPDIVEAAGDDAANMTPTKFLHYLRKIDKASLSDDEIRAVQGAAGMRAIYETLKKQVLKA